MTSRPRAAATAAIGAGVPSIFSLLALLAAPARAQPAPPLTTVTACSFDGAALDLALAVELQTTGAAIAAATATISITVTCATDGTATVTVQHGDLPPTSRSLDLVDVPAPLAPRVVALVAVAAVAAVHRSPPPPSALPVSGPSTPDAAAAPAPMRSPPAETRVDVTATTTRASLGSTGLSSHPRGVSGRALARLHDGTTALWGASAALTAGPGSLGVAAAGARIDHALGQLTPWLVAAQLGVTVACAGAACAALHVEVGRISVAAVATDPMVSTRPLAATYVHGAAELSLGTRLAGLEVAAVAALGVSRGVIARVDTEAVAVLAGWTLGGAIEVRR